MYKLTIEGKTTEYDNIFDLLKDVPEMARIQAEAINAEVMKLTESNGSSPAHED